MEATNLNGPLVSILTPSDPSKPLVTMTISTSKDFQHRLAKIALRATLNDLLNVVFQHERTGSLSPVTVIQLYDACVIRVNRKIAAGPFIVEVAGFAAVAC